MEYGFFQDAFSEDEIDTIVPNEEDRNYIDDVIWNQLVRGDFRDESRQEYVRIINDLVLGGAEGIILGCTEIPLLVKPEYVSVPTYDTATIHALAILEKALSE